MAETWRLTSRTTGQTVVAQLWIADSFFSRLAGLQFRRTLPPDAGLLLVPCNSVHTCFLRLALDVVFLDRQGVVLAVRRNVRPWRLTLGPRNGYATLELAAGTTQVRPGDTLRLTAASGGPPPTSVAFLRN